MVLNSDFEEEFLLSELLNDLMLKEQKVEDLDQNGLPVDESGSNLKDELEKLINYSNFAKKLCPLIPQSKLFRNRVLSLNTLEDCS